jgi:hypothetical protein
MATKADVFRLSCEQLEQLRKFWVNHEIPPGQVFEIAEVIDREYPLRPSLPQIDSTRPNPHWPPNKLG